MEPTKTYTELLRDPRWQRMRLEVMQRDGFACLECGGETQTLNVHHAFYVFGRAPWEYESTTLRTLCESCHESITEAVTYIRQFIGAMSMKELKRVIAFLRCPRPVPTDLVTDRERLREKLQTADHEEALAVFRQMMGATDGR